MGKRKSGIEVNALTLTVVFHEIAKMLATLPDGTRFESIEQWYHKGEYSTETFAFTACFLCPSSTPLTLMSDTLALHRIGTLSEEGTKEDAKRYGREKLKR